MADSDKPEAKDVTESKRDNEGSGASDFDAVLEKIENLERKDSTKEAPAAAATARTEAKAEAEAKGPDEVAGTKADDAPAAAASEPPVVAPPVPPPAEGPPWLALAIAIATPILFFFVLPPLTRAGLWDPHELNVADLARRVALNLHGASNLALEGADNSLPHLNDLGRPQLPFTSMALGFKLFGLHEWAGRAPLAGWGLLGVLATYGFVSRLVDRRAGVFSAIALTTMPLYFVQARTMLGDIVTMSALAMAFGGLAVAVFDRDTEDRASTTARGAWLVVAFAGLLSGFYSRGALLGIAVPALGVGVAYILTIANSKRSFDTMAHAVGVASVASGAVAAYLAIAALGDKSHHDLSPWVGAMIRPPGKYPTFDFTVGHIAAALTPWSAFVPFALGRMFIPPQARSSDAFTRESETRVALVVGAAFAFAAHGWMVARTDLVAFAAPAILAAVCGVALRDYERGAHPSVAVGVGTAVLLGCSHHELHKLPEKAFNAFAILTGTFPESFKNTALSIWWVVLGGFAVIAFLTYVERYRPPFLGVPEWIRAKLPEPTREPFDPRGYLRVLLALRDAWDGMLALAYFAMVAGASLAGLALWVGTRQHAKWLPTLSLQMRDAVLNAWWVTAFVPLAVIFAVFFWCDVWMWAFDRARPFSRGSISRGFEPFEELADRLKKGRLGETVPKLVLGKIVVTDKELEDGIGPTCLFILVPLMYLQVPGVVFAGLYMSGVRPLIAAALAIPAGVALFLFLGFVGDLLRGSRPAFLVGFAAFVGAVLCFSFYPALANQLSPKEVFESYQRVHTSGEPLALLGVGGRTAAYYAGGQPLILRDTGSAYDWLTSGEQGKRRFLVVRAEELPRLNKVHRERTQSGENIPVIDARSSQIVLVASSLKEGEKNQNPLNRIVLDAAKAPKPQRKVEANLEDKLLVLGYDITDANGKLVDSVQPGKKYHMKTYFKVLAPVQSEWEMFIHIDGFHRRHNGDHKPAEGKYPMTLWTPNDVIVDDYELSLEPNFTPGPYSNFFGLFVGDSRMKVKSGPADGENRVNGGFINVR
jgi:4-amino-4-deoxy-L-arabinose transferase-like glycosyltransferase